MQQNVRHIFISALMFVFSRSLTLNLNTFYSYGDVAIIGGGLQTTLHSWPLSYEGS